MADLTDLATVKQWLNIAATTDDALLTRLITATSNYIQSWLNRVIASQSYTETRNGTGGTILMFSNYPVTAVSSLTIDDVAIPLATNTTMAGYRFSNQQIFLQGYGFSRGMGNVTMAYTAGYAAVPQELAQACIELVSLRYRERDRIGHVSKSLAGETVVFSQKDMSDDIRTILNNYKKVISL